MKFQPDSLAGTNVISRQEPGRLWVGATPYATSLLVPWQGEVKAWGAATSEELTATHFEQVAALAPEVVIFGSGLRLRFLHPSVLRPLIERRVGVETMDTAAACRTYNVLVAEGRRVLAALLLGVPDQP